MMKKSLNLLAKIAQVSLISMVSMSLIVPAIALPLSHDQDTESQLIAQAAKKKRVAVLDFDFSTISNPYLLSLFPGLAKGTSDILVNSLVNTASYSVIERSQIEAILAEQNLGASGLVDVSTAARIGRILGVQYIILGSVTQFDVQERNTGVNVGGLFGNKRRKVQANVKINTRMVDTSTSEIVAAFEGKGSVEQKDGSTSVFGVSGGSSTDNREQLLSEATTIAVAEITSKLSDFAKK
jgi:curli biogenesis system outer membrane secretion channel CsgG